MKVWSVPVNFPNPEKEPEQAKAAVSFISMLPGLKGICPHSEGMVLLAFDAIENARTAKWKLEEFTDADLPLIEGTLTTENGKQKLNCNKVLKEGN